MAVLKGHGVLKLFVDGKEWSDITPLNILEYNQVTMEEVMPKYYCGYVDVIMPIRVNILGVEHFIPVGQRIAVTVCGDLAIAHGYQEACFFVDGKIKERQDV